MFWGLAAATVVVCVPIALTGLQLDALFYNPDYYLSGEVRRAVGRTTEYTPDQLRPINAAIVDFFKSPNLALPVALADQGADRGVFNAREVGHMNDVRGIVRLVGRLTNLALTLIVGVAAGRVAREGRPAVRWVAARLLAGAGLTVAIVAVMGVLTLVDFERLFLAFHLLSFDNSLWQLDPRTDNLIRFFPFEFWFDATVTVAIRTVLSAVVLAVAAWAARRWEGRTAT